MQEILREADGQIRASFIDAVGEATAPTGPEVTIVRDSDGATIAEAGAATDEGDGDVSYEISADDLPTVDLLHVSWTADDAAAPDDQVAVVGGFLCSLSAIADAITAANGTVPDVEDLKIARRRAEEIIEGRNACNVAFRPSYHRDTVNSRVGRLRLSRRRPLRVLSASIDDEAIDLGELSLSLEGYLHRDSGWPYSGISIAYEHGYSVPPEPIRSAAIALAQHIAASVGETDRVTRFREDDQEFWLAVGGIDGATSLPEVNAAIRAYKTPVIA